MKMISCSRWSFGPVLIVGSASGMDTVGADLLPTQGLGVKIGNFTSWRLRVFFFSRLISSLPADEPLASRP
jgi:hypothetical protein